MGTSPGEVWLQDRLVPASEAHISVFDRGFRSGEGVFETFRAYGDHPFRLDTHLDRAAAGAAALGLHLPPRELLAHAVRATAAANADGSDLALRLTVTPGVIDPTSSFPGTPTGPPTLVVTAHPLHVPRRIHDEGVAVACVPRLREVPTVKAVSYLTASLARREAAARGASEALLVDEEGEVREGSYSNVFSLVDGVLVTPPISAGILPGVTRAVVLEIADRIGLATAEERVTVDDLRRADEVLLTATTREIVPVTRVDEEPIGGGRPGRTAARLLETYREEVRREIASADGR